MKEFQRLFLNAYHDTTKVTGFIEVRYHKKIKASCSLNLGNIFYWTKRMQVKYFIILCKEPVVDLMGCLTMLEKSKKKIRFVPPEYWQEMLHYWRTDDDFKKRSEKGKKARASLKCGSLHTAGAINQITVRDRMKKELGRPITQDELFKATHLRKKKKSTDEDTWVEARAQETYKKYMKKIEELHSQGVTPSQEQHVEIWSPRKSISRKRVSVVLCTFFWH